MHLGYLHKYDDGRILRKECVSLKKALGADITYITSDRNGTTEKTELEGIRIRVIHAVPKRGLRLFRYMRDALTEIDKIGPDICHIHEFVLYPLVGKLKRRGFKVILDMHENDVEDETERFSAKYGKAVGKTVRKLLLAFERATVKKADAVISVTPQIINRVSRYGRPTEMVANYPYKEDDVTFTFEEFRSRLDTACFAGGISDLWGIRAILKAMEAFPEMKLLLAGRASEEYVEKMKACPAWEKTEYFGSISFRQVKEEIYAKSGIGFALLSIYDGWIGREGTLGNTKLFEFMEFGIPVICTDYSLWKDIVLNGNCGLVVNPFDEEQIQNAVSWLREHPEEAYQMGQNGRKLVQEKYNWEQEALTLLRLYKKVEG